MDKTTPGHAGQRSTGGSGLKIIRSFQNKGLSSVATQIPDQIKLKQKIRHVPEGLYLQG